MRLEPIQRVTAGSEALSLATKAIREHSDRPRVDRIAAARSFVDLETAEAIVAFDELRQPPLRLGNDRAFGAYFACMVAMLGALLLLALRGLHVAVLSHHQAFVLAAIAPLGQATLIRLAWHMIKRSGLAIADSLNAASYPTIYHRGVLGNAEWDLLRLQRLAWLLADMVHTMRQGASLRELYRDYSRVELTRAATIWMLTQAWVGRQIGEWIPPYLSRPRAWCVTFAATAGCLYGGYGLIETAPQHILVYVGSWAVLILWGILRRPASGT